jgi:hypothetical protein
MRLNINAAAGRTYAFPGAGRNTMYTASGTMVDWVFAQAQKLRIPTMAFVVELRPESWNPGFVLPAREIVDVGEEVGNAKSSLGDAESSLGDAESSLGDAESSLGDAKSSLGDAESSLGDAESSLGDVQVLAATTTLAQIVAAGDMATWATEGVDEAQRACLGSWVLAVHFVADSFPAETSWWVV